MPLRDITADTVHATLRALRFHKPLASSPLVGLAVLEQRADAYGLRLPGTGPDPDHGSEPTGEVASTRHTLMARLLEDTAWARLSVLRGPDRAIARDELDAQRELVLLRADFATGHIELEAWAVLHYRYFGHGRRELKDIAAEVGVSRKTLSRRLSRGYDLMARALREQELRAETSRFGGHNLPPPRTRFIGREREMANLRPLLARHRLVVLTGPGGVGKSRLATELARGFAPDFDEGARLVELAPLGQEESVAHAAAQALALSPLTDKSWRETLLAALRQVQMLLVFDNCEHLTEPVAGLAQALLDGCPRLQIIATSRVRMPGVPAAAHCPVRPLPTPDHRPGEDAHTLLHVDAVRLFVDRAAAVVADFQLDPSSAGPVSRVCCRLEGIPLALELAAARLARSNLIELEQGLEHRFRLLHGDGRTSRPGHESLRAALDGSYALLDETDQRLLRRLSVFRGGGTVEDAVAVCADETLSDDEVEAGLARLVTASLLERREVQIPLHEGAGSLLHPNFRTDASRETPRFQMLETVREYAAELVAARGSHERWALRHMRHFATHAESWGRALTGAKADAIASHIARDQPNIRRALTWAAEAGRAEEALSAAAALEPWWDMRGLTSEGRSLLESLLSAVSSDCPPDLARAAMCTLAELIRLQGDHQVSILTAEKALALAEGTPDRLSFARAQGVLGRVYAVTGPLDLARAHAESSLTSYRELRIDDEVAKAHRDVGMIAVRETQFDEARTHFSACVEHARAAGDERLVATGLNGLGVIGRYTGDGPEAIRRFEGTLAIARIMDDRRLQSVALHNLAATAADLEQRDQARAYLREALPLARATGDRPGEAETLHSIALSSADPQEKIAVLEECITLAREIDHTALLVIALNSLGHERLRDGDLKLARALLDEGVTLGALLPENRSLARLHGNLCWVSAREGKLAESRRHLEQSIAYQKTTSNLLALAEMLAHVARIALELKRPTQAARVLGAVEAVYRHAGAEQPQHSIECHAPSLKKVRDLLGAAEAEREREMGAALDFADALTVALDAVSPEPG